MQFFVDRPVFATVIAFIISLVGLIAVRQLAIEQYPNVAPPQVAVTATYPGASPELLENVVAAPLEREVNGVVGGTDAAQGRVRAGHRSRSRDGRGEQPREARRAAAAAGGAGERRPG